MCGSQQGRASLGRSGELGEPVPSHTLQAADAEKELSVCRDAEASKGNPADLKAMGEAWREQGLFLVLAAVNERHTHAYPCECMHTEREHVPGAHSPPKVFLQCLRQI